MQQQKVKSLAASSGNSKAFREAMKTNYLKGYRCAPFVAIFYRDIVFLDDGNPNHLEDKINFLKCVNMYNTMFQILRFQGRFYNITPNPDFIREVLSFNVIEEDTLYEMSLERQPRGVK